MKKTTKWWLMGGAVAFTSAILIFVKRKPILKYIKEKYENIIAEYATKWVGIKEVGANSGFANNVFQQMMKRVGWKSGEAWCMYFAKAIHLETFPDEKNKIDSILTGSSQQSYVNAQNDASGTYKISSTPQKGDIAIFQNIKQPTIGHAGVVVAVNKNNTMELVEGNTSDKSISDGDLVAQKTRTSIKGQPIGADLILRGFIRKNLA